MLARLVVVLGTLFLQGCADGIIGPGADTIDLTVQGRVVSSAGDAVDGGEVSLFAGSYWSGNGVGQARARTDADGSFALRLRARCQDPRMTVRVWDADGMSEWNTAQTPDAFSHVIRCSPEPQEVVVTVD